MFSIDADNAETRLSRSRVNTEYDCHSGNQHKPSSSLTDCDAKVMAKPYKAAAENLQRSENVLRDISVGIDVLHVVKVLEHVDQAHDTGCRGGI